LRTKASGIFLLDANVLIALSWPMHVAHQQVGSWFARRGHLGWATCPFTQSAFVRIVCNPAFSRDALTPGTALRLLQANLEHPGHHFWPADIGLGDAIRRLGHGLTGHRQVTDAYLLGLVLHRRARLATLDGKIASLMMGGGEAGVVELI